MQIKFNNVHKKYSNTIIFNDLNIIVEINDILLVTGESGSGKTTLCNMILEIDKNYSGVISFNEDKKISLMPQMNMFFENTTCYENIVTFTDNNKKINQLFKDVGLEGYQQKLISELSGGQKQRVNLIRALINEPDCIILDEPTANLDDDLSLSIIDLIKKFSSKGMKFIIITHDPLLIEGDYDRIHIDSEVKYIGNICKNKNMNGKRIKNNISVKKATKIIENSSKKLLFKNSFFMCIITILMILTTLFFFSKNNEFESTIERFFGKNGYILSSNHTVDLSNGCDKILDYETCREGVIPIIGYKYFTQEEIDYLASYEGIKSMSLSYDVNGGGNSTYTYNLNSVDIEKLWTRVDEYNKKANETLDIKQNNPLMTLPDDISKLQNYGDMASWATIYDVKYGEISDLVEDYIILSENMAKMFAFEKNISVEELIGQEIEFDTIDKETRKQEKIKYKVGWIYESKDNHEVMYAPKITTNYDKILYDHDSVFSEQIFFIDDEITQELFSTGASSFYYDELVNSDVEMPENDLEIIEELNMERKTKESYREILKTGYDTVYLALKPGYTYTMFLNYIDKGPEPLVERTIQYKEQLLEDKAYNKNYGRIKWIALELFLSGIVISILLLIYLKNLKHQYKILKLMGVSQKNILEINFKILFKTICGSIIVSIILAYALSQIFEFFDIYFKLYLFDYIKVTLISISLYLILLTIFTYYTFKKLAKVGINEG